jgi:hypothetical protein
MEPALEFGHQPGQEAAVLADAVAAQRGSARLRPLLEETQRLTLGLADAHVAVQNTLPQPRCRVMLRVPCVHVAEHGLRVADGVHRADGQFIEVGVGHHRRDLEDRIVGRVQARHFEVEPDQPRAQGWVHDAQGYNSPDDWGTTAACPAGA